MKWRVMIALAAVALTTVSAKAIEATKELSIGAFGTPHTISVSTSAWTKVPSSTTLNRRTGYIVSNPATNSANMVAHLGNCSSTTIATTVRPQEILKGNGFVFEPNDANVCLWMLSLHTSAENVHVQEVAQ